MNQRSISYKDILKKVEELEENPEFKVLWQGFKNADDGDPEAQRHQFALIDRWMIENYGMNLTDYTSKTVSEALRDRIYNEDGQIRADAWSLEDALFNDNTKEDLIDLARRIRLKGSSRLNKKDLAEHIAGALLRPESMVDRISALPDKTISLFERLAGSDASVTYQDSEREAARELADSYLALTFSGNKVLVTQDVAVAYREAWSAEAEELRQRRTWLYKCLVISADFYGIMSWTILMKLMRRKFGDMNVKEVRELFRSTPERHQWFSELDAKLVVFGYDEDGFYKHYERDRQRDKPYYIPSAAEIEEFYDKGCILSEPSYMKLCNYLVKRFKLSRSEAEGRMCQLYQLINDEARLDDQRDALLLKPGAEKQEYKNESGVVVYDYSDDDYFVFKSDSEAEKFFMMIVDAHENTRMRINRGHKPREVS